MIRWMRWGFLRLKLWSSCSEFSSPYQILTFHDPTKSLYIIVRRIVVPFSVDTLFFYNETLKTWCRFLYYYCHFQMVHYHRRHQMLTLIPPISEIIKFWNCFELQRLALFKISQGFKKKHENLQRQLTEKWWLKDVDVRTGITKRSSWYPEYVVWISPILAR